MKRPLHLVVLFAFAALLTQGFQCASSGVTSAKKAIQAKDYVKAKSELDTVLAHEPNNCEAMVLLGDVHAAMNDVTAMAEAYSKAMECPGMNDQTSDELSIKMYNAWAAAFNDGVQSFNRFVETKADSDIVNAEASLRSAIRLKPANSMPYNLLGNVLETRGDTNAAYTVYETWWKQEQPAVDILLKKGLNLTSVHADVIAALGAPKETKIDSVKDGETLEGITVKDLFDVGGRDLYVFSTKESGKADTVIEGWRYNPSPKLSDPEKWFPVVFSINPLKGLAFIDYQKGRKEKALEYATVVTNLNPKDNDLVPLRTQLLQDLGKTDEALSEIKANVNKDPENVQYRMQYAVLLSNVGRKEEATTQYKEILKRDPKNGTALFNLAANYKNIAGDKQMVELKKLDADENYKIDTNYMGDLRIAAQYFEELRKQPKYATDLVVLEQLANTYEVLKEKSKVKSLIMELEGLEAKYSNDKEYYRVMVGLYGRNNMIDKMKAAEAKGERVK